MAGRPGYHYHYDYDKMEGYVRYGGEVYEIFLPFSDEEDMGPLSSSDDSSDCDSRPAIVDLMEEPVETIHYNIAANFPDCIPGSVVEEVNEIIRTALETGDPSLLPPDLRVAGVVLPYMPNPNKTLPIGTLASIIGHLGLIFDKAKSRPGLPSSAVTETIMSNYWIRTSFDYSQDELRKVPGDIFEGVLGWCSWLTDKIAAQRTPAAANSAFLSDGAEGPAALELEGRLIARCTLAAAQLFKLTFSMLYHPSNYNFHKTNCSARLIHHARIFESSMKAYAAFLGESDGPPPLDVVFTMDPPETPTFSECPVESFSLAGMSGVVYSEHFMAVHHCTDCEVYHLYPLFNPCFTRHLHPQSIDIPVYKSPSRPPSVFPSEDFTAVVVHPAKGTAGGKLLLFSFHNPGDTPITSINIADLGRVLNTFSTGTFGIGEIVNVFMTTNPDGSEDDIHMVIHCTDKKGTPTVAVLRFNQYRFKLSSSVIALIPGGSLVSAKNTTYFIQEGGNVVLYEAFEPNHHELGRTASEASNPWNIRYDADMGFDNLYLFYRGREIQIRTSDKLTLTRKAILDTLPGGNYNLFFSGDLIMGQYEHSLEVPCQTTPTLPYFEPFIFTLDKPTPVYLPLCPRLWADTITVYAGRFTLVSEGTLEVMYATLKGEHPQTAVFQNIEFEVFTGRDGRGKLMKKIQGELDEREELARKAREAKRLKEEAKRAEHEARNKKRNKKINKRRNKKRSKKRAF